MSVSLAALSPVSRPGPWEAKPGEGTEISHARGATVPHSYGLSPRSRVEGRALTHLQSF